MTDANLLSSRIYLSVHCGRNNRHYSSKLIPRYCSTRHILRSGTLSLCPINGGSIRHHRRRNTLISTIHRILPKPNSNKNSILSNIPRRQHNILPTTLFRTLRNTSSILGLPRRLHPMKHNLINRFNHLTSSSSHITIHCLRSHNTQTNPTNPIRKKNPCRMILRNTTTTPHPHRTNIYTKQYVRPNPRIYHIHGVTLTREETDFNCHLLISSQPHSSLCFPLENLVNTLHSFVIAK